MEAVNTRDFSLLNNMDLQREVELSPESHNQEKEAAPRFRSDLAFLLVCYPNMPEQNMRGKNNKN